MLNRNRRPPQDIYAHMIETGWDKKPGVTIVFGRWQDKLPELGTYDGIFFDTYGTPALFQAPLSRHTKEAPAGLDPSTFLAPSRRVFA